ncbi:hypothetical protein FocTR4_00003381 [Fusarium oxysporum f. sp. cubense]|nr:hypothetical protein FocTR4_00003381 [Fusarium oxysporum f. sp. cubense]
MLSSLTTTVNVISVAVYTMVRPTGSVIETEKMLDTIQLPIVLTSGQEQLGSDVQATPTEDASKISASQKAATETLPPVTPTLFIYNADEYMIHTPTGSVISANPTATTIELGCPVQSDCPYEYSNTFVVGPWASTVVPEGLASTGTFHWYLANSYWGTALSVECLMSSGMPQTCTRLVTGMQTRTWDSEDIHAGTVTDTATNMIPGATLGTRFTHMSIVITAGQELLGEATSTTTDRASPEKTNGAGPSAACVMGVMAIATLHHQHPTIVIRYITKMSSALTTPVFILPFALYKERTPSAAVIAANPTATTLQLYCPDEVSAECKSSGYNNSIVVGPWASKTVPAGAASTGIFHWMLALNDLGGVSSVECLVSSGTPQTCTTMMLPKETGEDGITDVATGFGSITKEFELKFGTLPIVITKGQELLETTSQATTTEDSSAAQATGSETEATSAEVTATSTSTDAAAPKETNGAGSSAVRMLSTIFMAGLASLIVQF